MTDQNSTNNNSASQSQDDFYKDVSGLNVSEDELNIMAALTQAQVDAAERAGDMVDEMKELIKQENQEE